MVIIRKNETLADAFARILETELGFKASFSDAKLIGVYEHIYETNTMGAPGYGTHYVVLAHELNLIERPPIVGDAQHADFRWMPASEIGSSADVHPNTRVLFLGRALTGDTLLAF